jgi:hypothetical protein
MSIPLLWELDLDGTHGKDALPYWEVVCETHVASLELT